MTMKKRIAIISCIVLILAAFMLGGCTESCQRSCKSLESDFGGGLYREINVYTHTGELIAHYEGKVDIEENESGGKVLFDLDGKRYVYYNCLVEVIEVDEPKN